MVGLDQAPAINMPDSSQPIVSSDHLAGKNSTELSELEYGLIIADNAFQRWITHCMKASGNRELNPTDVLVLHNVYHRQRPKRVTDICFTLNIEDTHLVSYALRKLRKMGLIDSEKRGKEVLFSTTATGQALCERYAEVRRGCLVEAMSAIGVDKQELGEVARVLRMISGLYDQAARAATSL